jgi:anti-sigma regulatory factor (Ser/Thr protein kinase)
MPEERLRLTVATRTEELARVREALRHWLRGGAATKRDEFAIVLASNEACANAMEHAYDHAEATYDLEAACLDDVVGITVRDSGRWREPRDSGRGRGIGVMRAFMDHVDISSDESGTTVQMSKQLGEGA